MLFNLEEAKKHWCKQEIEQMEMYMKMQPGSIIRFSGYITGENVYKYFEHIAEILEDDTLNTAAIHKAIPNTEDIVFNFSCKPDLDCEFIIYSEDDELGDPDFYEKTIKITPEKLDKLIDVCKWGGKAEGYMFMGLKDYANNDLDYEINPSDYAITKIIEF